MKSKHRISRIEGDTITLDNQKKYKADVFGSSKLRFWSEHFYEVEIEGSGMSTRLTNLKRNETIKAEETLLMG
jgi:hypothetical protein